MAWIKRENLFKIAAAIAGSVFISSTIILRLMDVSWSTLLPLSLMVSVVAFVFSVNILAVVFRASTPGKRTTDDGMQSSSPFSNATYRDDWYNDVTNPISPIYQITRDSTQQSPPASNDSHSSRWS